MERLLTCWIHRINCSLFLLWENICFWLGSRKHNVISRVPLKVTRKIIVLEHFKWFRSVVGKSEIFVVFFVLASTLWSNNPVFGSSIKNLLKGKSMSWLAWFCFIFSYTSIPCPAPTCTCRPRVSHVVILTAGRIMFCCTNSLCTMRRFELLGWTLFLLMHIQILCTQKLFPSVAFNVCFDRYILLLQSKLWGNWLL